MKRRDFLEISALATGAMALPIRVPSAMPDSKQKNPDIIIFMPDQWNPRFTGYAGAQVQTPNLDRMAGEGMVFESCYTPCPVCMPARCCFTSGLYPHNQALWGNGPYNQMPEDNRLFLDLKASGYYTAQIGKIHRYSGNSWRQRSPAKSFKEYMELCGIDYYEKTITPATIRHASGQYRARLKRLGIFDEYVADIKDRMLVNQYMVRPAVVEPKDHPDAYVAERTIEFIKQHPVDQPLFLMVTFPSPHTPLDACGKYEKMYDPKVLKLLPNVKDFSRDGTDYTSGEVKKMYGSYFDKITMIDDLIGEIIDALRKRGTWDNTLAFFTSDHGEMIGSQGRVSKGVFYEESGRVPMVVRWPGHIPGDRKSDALVQTMDIYPTAIEAVGGKLSKIILRYLCCRLPSAQQKAAVMRFLAKLRPHAARISCAV